MNGTKDEVLTLRRSYHNRSNLLLDFQVSLNPEVVRMRNRISQICQVDADGFFFVSNVCSVSVPFESTVFEHEEGSGEELTRREKLQCTFGSIRLWLSKARVEEVQPAATALASTFLSIAKTIS